MGSLRKQREIQTLRRRHAHREEAHVTTETGGLRLQAKECQGPPEVEPMKLLNSWTLRTL